MKRILIGGSPCTHWSIIRNKNRETKASGIGWELFKNYLIVKNDFKPDYFLYENNESISKEIQKQIGIELDNEVIHINSSLVSAQNRKRIYVTNCKVEQPNDRNILLNDILEKDVEPIALSRPRYKETKCRIYADGKSPTITAAGGGEHIPRVLFKGHTANEITAENYKSISREMLVCEVEKLQTMPKDYTQGLCKTHAMNALGNGWTAEVIKHIIKAWNIPTSEPIEVVSMYDGIGTGRYCFDILGYKNIIYYAYEIDKNAIKCAMNNYKDIIQKGNAFDVRKKELITV